VEWEISDGPQMTQIIAEEKTIGGASHPSASLCVICGLSRTAKKALLGRALQGNAKTKPADGAREASRATARE